MPVRMTDLTDVQERLLVEVSGFVHCHITKDSPHYEDTLALQSRRLIQLAGGNTCPLKGIYITDTGRKYLENLKARGKQ